MKKCDSIWPIVLSILSAVLLPHVSNAQALYILDAKVDGCSISRALGDGSVSIMPIVPEFSCAAEDSPWTKGRYLVRCKYLDDVPRGSNRSARSTMSLSNDIYGDGVDKKSASAAVVDFEKIKKKCVNAVVADMHPVGSGWMTYIWGDDKSGGFSGEVVEVVKANTKYRVRVTNIDQMTHWTQLNPHSCIENRALIKGRDEGRILTVDAGCFSPR